MRSVIKYNSWEEKFKAPFGALKINESVKIAVNVDEKYDIESITWVIFKEDVEINRIKLSKEYESDKESSEMEGYQDFRGNIEGFKEAALYFYYFEVDVNIDGNLHKLFYGRNNENGYACESAYENINKYQITVYEDFKVPSWYKEGILYHIFVDRFNNGNRNKKTSNPKENSFIYANWTDTPMYIKDEVGNIIRWDFQGGNLRGIISKLGYLKKLGVTMLYLSPIFESSSNHKYDTGDYKKIDSMFGDEEIFKELIAKAKSKGISIILDGVFSHTGADSKYFNKYGRYSDVGAYQSKDSKYSSWYAFEDFPDKYECWWKIKSLPNTNELDPSFMDYIIYDSDSVIKKWTSMGVKGWRLDVADELPTKFIRELKKELKNIDEDSILAGEVWEDASNKISYNERRSYLLGEELDSVMGYPFRKNLISFLKGEIVSSQLNNRYIEIKENYPKEAFKSNLNLIGTHDVNRIKTELDNDKDMVKLAVATQMTFEGVPYIYYGDEAGLDGKTDPDNRKTYPWKNEDEDMIDFYKQIINIRTKSKAIVSGETIFINTQNDDVFAFTRLNEDKSVDNILIVLNRSNDDKEVILNIDGDTLEEVDIKYSSKKYGEILEKENNFFKIKLNSKSFRILNIKNNINTEV